MAIDFRGLLKRFDVSDVNEYMTIQESADKWEAMPRQVQILCKEGRIGGVTRIIHIWIIPKDAKKLTASKRKARDTDE